MAIPAPSMYEWGQDELDRLGRGDEIGIASRRADGTLRGCVTIWAVRVGDEVYVRSANGYDNPCFQRRFEPGAPASGLAGWSEMSPSTRPRPTPPTG